MIYAVYTLPQVIKLSDIFTQDSKIIQETYFTKDFNYVRWGYIHNFHKDDSPEVIGSDVNTIIILFVKNDRITPFATGEEIDEMFKNLIRDNKIKSFINGENNLGQQEIRVKFHDME